MTTKPWVDDRSHPASISYFEGYDAAIRAAPLVEKGDYQDATEILEPHLNGPGGGETALRLLDHDIKLNLGRYEDARATLEVAIQAPDAAYGAFQKLGEFINRQGDYRAGLKVFESAFTEFDEAGRAYPPLISQYNVVGDRQMAKRLVDRCRVNHRAFLKLCKEAASPTTAATIKAGRLPPAARSQRHHFIVKGRNPQKRRS